MTTAGRTFAGRYALDVQISTTVGTPVWRALDQVLRRWVTLYLMPRSDSRSPAVIAACLKVSSNSSRNVVAILDVIEAGHITGIATISPSEDYLGVVSEWVEGEGLDRRLARTDEPFAPEAALEIARKITAALATAHELGISHGRLRPHNIIFSDSGEIRLSGFGIESSVLGADRTNAIQSDIHGIGNLLFAMVTGTWPHEAVDGLPGAEGPGVPEPSRIVAGITPAIDRFFLATQDGTYLSISEVQTALSVESVEHLAQESSPLVRLAQDVAAQVHAPAAKSGRRVRTEAADAPAPEASPEPETYAVEPSSDDAPVDAATDLAPPAAPTRTPRLATLPKATRSAAATRLMTSPQVERIAKAASVDRITSHPPVEWQGEPDGSAYRNKVAGIALGSVLVFGWIGWQILTSSFGDVEAPEALVITPLATLSAAPSPTQAREPEPVTPASAIDYDPFGDKTENGPLAPKAIDGDTDTAWKTVVYRGDGLAGKPGVGLLVDLGKSRDVASVKLTFTNSGHDATVFVTDSDTPDVKTDSEFGTVRGSGTTETVAADKPVSGRYVLVWLTRVPQIPTGSYQGGLVEVSIQS